MQALTSENFVKQWAAENGFTIEAGSNERDPPAYVLLDNGERTCIYRGETIELAFSRMESVLKGQDPFA